MVTAVHSEHILLGAPEIIDRLDILTPQNGRQNTGTAVEQKQRSQLSEAHVNRSDITRLVDKYNNLFESALSKYTLCNVGEHSIRTYGDPIAIPCGRVPHHWEAAIEQEM